MCRRRKNQPGRIQPAGEITVRKRPRRCSRIGRVLAMVMGKYLTPKLYVRYLTGIVEASSIVQVNYQLNRRVQIQTEGGYRGSESITGGDVYYTIEH